MWRYLAWNIYYRLIWCILYRIGFPIYTGKEVIFHSNLLWPCLIKSTISSVFWSQVTNWGAWGSQAIQKHVITMNITTVSEVTAPRAISTSSTQICTSTTRISEGMKCYINRVSRYSCLTEFSCISIETAAIKWPYLVNTFSIEKTKVFINGTLVYVSDTVRSSVTRFTHTVMSHSFVYTNHSGSVAQRLAAWRSYKIRAKSASVSWITWAAIWCSFT